MGSWFYKTDIIMAKSLKSERTCWTALKNILEKICKLSVTI